MRAKPRSETMIRSWRRTWVPTRRGRGREGDSVTTGVVSDGDNGIGGAQAVILALHKPGRAAKSTKTSA